MSGTQMRQILISSPRLHTFVTLLQGGLTGSKVPHFSAKVPNFMAKDFIDLDSSSNALKPWKCEYSLRVFHAKILGIPRPDVTTDRRGFPRLDVLQEAYPGESQELQSRVYERLAKFTRLVKLGLGHDDRDLNDILLDSINNIDGNHVFGDDDHQYDCLEMTLKSGLGMLEGLKKLKELNVMRMTTRIGVDEVKWMRKNWPNLQTIIGLDIRGNEMEAAQWLKEECPQVKLTAYSMD
ncbi:hypothetical protein BGZ99_004503 [Dissophora globulifera]|uniref:Uncharacterized protein n=1 Tax=Dissophora globulifera TaxID=979702 RepID=A0A9P6RHK1_9FUNG|nr:hypothetical protein BGZ99_004503 [Dissophora globulifera]